MCNLAQQVERSSAEWDVPGSIPDGANAQILKQQKRFFPASFFFFFFFFFFASYT